MRYSIGFCFILLLLTIWSCGSDTTNTLVEVKIDTLAEKTNEILQWYTDARDPIQSRLDSIEQSISGVVDLPLCTGDFSNWNDTDQYGGYLYTNYIFDPGAESYPTFNGGFWNWRNQIDLFLHDTTFLLDKYNDPERHYYGLCLNKGYYSEFFRLRYLIIVTTLEYEEGHGGWGMFMPGKYKGQMYFVDLRSNCVILKKTFEVTNDDEINTTQNMSTGRSDANERIKGNLENNFMKKCYAAIEKKEASTSK